MTASYLKNYLQSLSEQQGVILKDIEVFVSEQPGLFAPRLLETGALVSKIDSNKSVLILCPSAFVRDGSEIRSVFGFEKNDKEK